MSQGAIDEQEANEDGPLLGVGAGLRDGAVRPYAGPPMLNFHNVMSTRVSSSPLGRRSPPEVTMAQLPSLESGTGISSSAMAPSFWNLMV